MAYLKRRINKWFACYSVAGKKVIKTTGISVKSPSMPAASLKKLAQQTADLMEKTARGEIEVNRALDAVRSVAEAAGLNASMPTIREHFMNVLAQKGCSYAPPINHFLAYLGERAERRLDTLTPSIVSEYLKEETKRIQRSTIKLYKDILSAALNIARKDRLIQYNAAADAEMPKLAEKQETKRTAFTLDQIHELIRKLPPQLSALVEICFLTGGQRLGDIATLQWKNVDFKERVISFRTKKVERPMLIPFSPRLEELLLSLRNSESYVLPEMAHMYLRGAGKLSSYFTGYLEMLGFIDRPKEKMQGDRHYVPKLSFHSLRHSVVSFLRASNQFSPDIARSVVGHASEAVERAYFHAPDDRKQAGYNYLSSLIKTAPTHRKSSM